MRVQANGNGNGNGNGAMANGASSDGSSALCEEDSTGVRRLLKLLKVSTSRGPQRHGSPQSRCCCP